MNPLLLQVKTLLAGADFDWAVCGGFALDLFLGRETRVHGDIDLMAPERDRARIQRSMLERGWNVYEFRGQGRLRPLNADTPSEPGRNLMCVCEGCELVTFWPCDEPGMVLHEWHASGIQALNYMEFLFHERNGDELLLGQGVCMRRDEAILVREGVPYLAPEAVLMYKAAQPDRVANRADFEAAFPEMNEARRCWLLEGLKRLAPSEHPWAAIEWWDVYDFQRRRTGRIIRRGERMSAEEYHLVVQVWIRNSRGEWLISRRAPGKSEPLKWEPTGGSVLAGEDSLSGALREVREELGITLDPAKGRLFCSARREQFTWANPGFLDVWIFEHDCDMSDVILQTTETCAASWASEDDIRRMIVSGDFVPMTNDDYVDDLFRAARYGTREGMKNHDL